MSALEMEWRPVPCEVTAVAGCDCGGMRWHRTDCSIYELPHEQVKAAVDDAEGRLREYVDGLNAQIRDA